MCDINLTGGPITKPRNAEMVRMTGDDDRQAGLARGLPPSVPPLPHPNLEWFLRSAASL